MTEPNRTFRIWRLWAAMALPLLLLACANPALREADRLRASGQHEAALRRLQSAYQADPQDQAVKAAFIKQRDSTVADLIYRAEAAKSAGQVAGHRQFLQRLEATAPGDPRVQAMRSDLERGKRQAALMGEAESAYKRQDFANAEAALRQMLSAEPAHAAARALLGQIDEKRSEQTRRQSNVKLASSQKPVTLEFREAALRTVFEALARAAGVNFVLDKDVRGDAKVTLFMKDTTVDEAMRLLLNTQQLGYRLLNDNTVLIYPNNSQKQRDLLDTVTRNFYLVNADPKQAMALVRTVAKTRDLFVDERLNLLVVRDTPEVMRLVERLIAGIDLPDPEVMLELEVMEVSSKKINELGLSLPESIEYGIPGAGGILTSVRGLRSSVANPLAVAVLRGGTDLTNLLANPKIRVRNRDKAKINLGEKLPVFTTTTTNSTAVSTAVSISYVDVGLKLELEPQVQLNDEVIIKVGLDVTNITSRVAGPSGSLAYQVGSRAATTSLRLKDGETQVLGGLINDDESKNAAGLPWLHELPLIGRLFGTQSDTHNKTEVVFLITPHIIRNLGQSPLPAEPMPSGTESQPGAAPFMLERSRASTEGMPAGGVPVAAAGTGPAVPTASATMAASAPASAALPTLPPSAQAVPYLSGPETVLPEASFQVTVHNPGKEPLDTDLVFDPNVFEVSGEGADTGRVALRLPGQATLPVAVSVKEGVFGRSAELRLDRVDRAMTIVIGEATR